MFILQCDKCKTQAEPKGGKKVPEDWRELTFQQTYPNPEVRFQLCPQCVKVLKLGDAKTRDLSEEIVEIIGDIAVDAVDSQ